MKANEILRKGAEHIEDRAATRDCEDGERSMAATVAMFNAATGKDISEADGWMFMVFLKIARSLAGGYNPDDYEDMAAYAALLGETVAAANVNPSSIELNLSDIKIPDGVWHGFDITVSGEGTTLLEDSEKVLRPGEVLVKPADLPRCDNCCTPGHIQCGSFCDSRKEHLKKIRDGGE